MATRRKPISFDTTLRNPTRIPQFISILKKFEGRILDSEVALTLEAEIIRMKIFEPTKSTLGKYTQKYTGKFKFEAEDQSNYAEEKVTRYYNEWEKSEAGSQDVDKIIYLLKNTITAHKEKNWAGGWESRLHTQFNFLNELGFVRVVKGEKILISQNGNLMIKEYENGYPKNEIYDESFEQSAFLNAFSKYQINNPYRKNTINVNFFHLVLSVIQYLDTKYNRPGISKQDLPFIITWGNNDYVTLAEYIYSFRQRFGYNVSDDIVYAYAMNLMDDTTPNNVLSPASDEFIESKKKDYKYKKIVTETPDEIIRKLRLTMLISLRGAGRFIDINKNETEKIEHILNTYNINKIYEQNTVDYFEYMGSIDTKLVFDKTTLETEEAKDAKISAIESWAKNSDWEFIKREMLNSIDKRPTSNLVLKYIKETARMEFLSAIAIKKALPSCRVIANYKADDQGIPFNTAMGGRNNQVGADIDVYEKNIHAIMEPTISKSRSFQVEHELPSIRNHVIESAKKDIEEKNGYTNWFCIFIAPNISRDVGDQVALIKLLNKVEIYPWDVEDFIDFSMQVNSISDYKIIREYVKPQELPI